MKETFIDKYFFDLGISLPFSIIILVLFTNISFAQLSPGDLAEPHSHLEGLSNCTQCHILGEKVSNDLCLDCHNDLKQQIDQKKGYHSSSEIAGKDCIKCHSDHHGKKFEMIRFDKEKFNHSLTGYNLIGTHKKQKCEDCHKAEFISSKEIKKKKNTFLGLKTDCLSCHADYHQNTLPIDCQQCHTLESFKPASKFKHENTKFLLKGKHKDLECIKCHKTITLNGKQIQQYPGIPFKSCTSCHTDVHNNKFGQNCTQCHTEQSFQIIKSMSGFDHNKTSFKLVDKHLNVDCKECHKTKLTDPLNHGRCTDCHDDYHKNQFAKQGLNPDCSDCHSTLGFKGSSFSIEQHNTSNFKLEGAHLATPCFVCHKKEEKWNFRNIGINCVDCHDDIHKKHIDEKYYPKSNCKNCHNVNTWAEISFEHSLTDYELLGKHKDQSCRACHFKVLDDGKDQQQFAWLTSNCTECHNDQHQNQFDVNGITDCLSCHDFNNWNADNFDHSKTLFPLDGKHKNVACAECHKSKIVGMTKFIQYKLNEFRCENCH